MILKFAVKESSFFAFADIAFSVKSSNKLFPSSNLKASNSLDSVKSVFINKSSNVLGRAFSPVSGSITLSLLYNSGLLVLIFSIAASINVSTLSPAKEKSLEDVEAEILLSNF